MPGRRGQRGQDRATWLRLARPRVWVCPRILGVGEGPACGFVQGEVSAFIQFSKGPPAILQGSGGTAFSAGGCWPWQTCIGARGQRAGWWDSGGYWVGVLWARVLGPAEGVPHPLAPP